MHITASKSLPKRSLLSSAVATIVNQQRMNAMFPMHNYVIKTCLTTYTYLSTVIQNKRSTVSTFETIVSVITTESLTDIFATSYKADIKPTHTKFTEVKTIQPSIQSNSQFQSSLFPKINKRIDSQMEDDSFELLQPSEVGPIPCSSSCSCSQSQTEHLDKYKTKFSHNIDASISVPLKRIPVKVSKLGVTKQEHLRPTNKENFSQQSKYPYEYESNINIAPTDKIVEKYTEVINDYSDEKESSVVKDSDLLTNEQAPNKSTKNANQKPNEKIKPDKPMKPNKNKFVVADLLKLGSLGIKGLTQLAPVIEKMTEGFMKRQETNKTTPSTTVKAVTNLTPYNLNKRVDSELAPKQGKFPIYIPVDELETSESQLVFTNGTLHQNLFWSSEHKHPKAHIMPPKLIHESPLVNGGIPISPGEIITANSDVILGKPAVGGPLTLAASGIKLQNSVNPPHIDSSISSSEHFITKEIPPNTKPSTIVYQGDDSYDLRPPDLPKTKPNRNLSKPNVPTNSHPLPPFVHQVINNSPKFTTQTHNDNLMKTEQMKTYNILGNHGRPAFLDYIPALGIPENNNNLASYSQHKHQNDMDIPDASPSSSEIVSTKIKHEGKYPLPEQSMSSLGKPFLVDIQPSKVANILIPHGSATALVFAGSSEPHKTGDYVDDPLPYPEPGYFGSFSIDAPQMTNVHNVALSKQKPLPPLHSSSGNLKPNSQSQKEMKYINDIKLKWKEYRRPTSDFNKLPPPTSNQETHIQIGPHITSYNPDLYKASDFERFHEKEHYHKTSKDVIDKEYENYLAVPPPPPKLMHNNNHEKNRPYSQRPIVHTKPIQDMKVFLNIQHPISATSNKNNQEQHPSKVTSEVYYAAQSPEFNKQSSMFNVQVPNEQVANEDNKNSYISTNFAIENNEPSRHSYSNNYANKDNSYTVTLNTGTNVAHSNSFIDAGQVIGTSIPVQIGTSTNNLVNTDIPVGTNFAIKVEDNVESNNEYYIENQPYSSNSNDHKVETNDNRWNATSIHIEDDKDTLFENNKYNAISGSTEKNLNNFSQHKNAAVIPSLNSHANFPMINDGLSTDSNDNYNIRQGNDNSQNSNYEGKRPPKVIPNIHSNSHGWYSSVPIKDLNLNNLKNIHDIKIEKSTRKNIPLSHEHSDILPDFGQKLSTIGLPPTKLLSSLDTVGKPFNNGNVGESKDNVPRRTTKKPFDYHYIPSNFGGMKQPAYDIPIRDNSDETTTYKITTQKATVNSLYENSEEIYDGASLSEGTVDGEVSEESMKVPIVSTSNTKNAVSKSTTQMTLLQEEVFEPYKNNNIHTHDKNKIELVHFNTGTQTEKPFIAEKYNQSNLFQTNAMKPILESDNYYNLKPRPFTVNTETILDHQLHQPHWQINQMWENTTNLSSDENIDLNMGEEMSTMKSTKPSPVSSNNDVKLRRPSRPVFSARPNKTVSFNVSNIITSTIHLMDKKPLTVLDDEGEFTGSTLPTFTLNTTNYELNNSSSEIIDLSPPPPTIDYHTPKDEIIMGMSPPPPINPIISQVRPPLPTRSPVTPRTPPPYRSKPPRTLPPRIPFTRPTRKPMKEHKDEVSTYRPSYDILKNNNMRRPGFNVDQPSSQLLPPPRHMSSVVNEIPLPSISNVTVIQNVVFPTPTSSGWLTSSGVGFSSKFDFTPTSVQFPEVSASSDKPESQSYSTEKSDNTELDTSPEGSNMLTTHEPAYKDVSEMDVGKIDSNVQTKEKSTEKSTSSSEEKSSSQPQSEEDSISTERANIVPLRNKNITRKPYPVRDSTKKPQSSRYKPIKSSDIIRPTRTLTRSDILYPTKQTSIKKIHPIPTRKPTIKPSIIESSESSIDDDYIKPTEVLKQKEIPTVVEYDESSTSISYNKMHDSSIINSISENLPVVKPTHHAGNEVKVYDEILPTKTEFRTTVITLTKTLSEAPQIVSSIGFINLTHTLTVTHTKTSLISQSEGAITETIIVTNTQTSTIVDVVTEVYTKVQPTTIIETVTKHIPIISVEPSSVAETPLKSISPLDNISMSSEEDNLIIKDGETTENIQKIEKEDENDTFYVIMNKSQNGGQSPPIQTDVENSDYEGITRNEQVNNNGVSQVLFGEILLAGTPFLETTNIGNPVFNKECQPDCKASRNERCQRIDGMMKCVCRPGFARMFPDRPCKPTYTYSVNLALSSRAKENLKYHQALADNSTKEYNSLALATHEGINRMIMQSDLRDVYHGVHITGFHPVEKNITSGNDSQGVMNEFYVQLSDNAHETRLKEVIEKYLRHNNYSLGGTDVFASDELVDKLAVTDFNECISGQFHDCSEHAQCFNLRGTYTCSCLEGFADLSVNNLYPGRICSSDPVGCEHCNYHGACYTRDDLRVLCECFQWYSGSSCQVNLKVVLISLVTLGVLLTITLIVCAVIACSKKSRPPQRSIVACIQGMPGIHQGVVPSKHRADRRALISERGGDSGDASSVQNASLPYIPTKKTSGVLKKCVISEPPSHEAPPPPAPAVMIPRARLHPTTRDSRDNSSRKQSVEQSNEEKLISYLESGVNSNDEMRRKHSVESSYSAYRERHSKQGALVSAGFKVSTTVRGDDSMMKEECDDSSSVNKQDLEAELSRFETLRKSYSQEELSQWTDAERRIGELTLSEARSVGGTLPASTGRAASSTRLTHQEANTMAERDLGSTFLLPHVHLYKPDITSDVSEFDSL